MGLKIVAAARQGAALLLCAAAPAFAAVPMLVPPTLTAKGAPVQPRDVHSVANAVRFNAAALHAMTIGEEAELALPNGTTHTFVLDQKLQDGNGNVTWIGYYRDADQRRMLRAIVTTGPDGSLGLIQTPNGDLSLRLGAGGTDWLVDSKAEAPHHPPIDLGHDMKRVALPALDATRPLASPAFVEPVGGVTVPSTSTTPFVTKVASTPSIVTVDMLLVYDASLAAGVGNVDTFIANLAAQANTSFADSKVGIALRIVDKMAVSYADITDNGQALNDITYGQGVFAGVASRRAAVGADMVTFYRGGNGSNGGSNSGAGVAWTPNSPMGGSWAPYMYSVVQGCWGSCQYIWTHEVGHNMGNMHDRATSAWENTVNPPDPSIPDQGSYPYSWGFYSCNGRVDDAVLTCNAFSGGCTNPAFSGKPNCTSGVNAFRDLMAYFHESTVLVRRFSNPDLDCPGSSPTLKCGIFDGVTDPQMAGRQASADTAQSMNNNRTALSALFATVVGGGSTATPTTTTVASSFNPAQVGSTFAFTATVTSGSGTPTGTVAFRYNGNLVNGCGALAVSGGTALCTASGLPQGQLSITAQFTGSGGFADSTSAVLTQAMVPLASMMPTAPRKMDFDGDGRHDIAWKGPTPDVWGVWLMAGASYGPTAYAIPPAAGSQLRATGDFNGDGRADLLWRNADGTYSISLMTGTTAAAPVTIGTPNSGWDVIGIGDFDGDGKSDLLWFSVNGQYRITLMNGTVAGAPTSLVPPSPSFYPAFIADFSGVRKDDLLWRTEAGALTIVLMNGTASAGQSALLGANTGWAPTHIADFNGDGRADLVLANTDGSVALWLIQGGAIVGSKVLQDNKGVPNGWSIALVRDLDGDGKADLVWRNANGTYAGWLMNGVTATAYGTLFGVANSGWTIVGAGDFTGDGKCDLLWRYVDGTYSTWVMNGLSPSSYGTVLNGGTGWEIAP